MYSGKLFVAIRISLDPIRFAIEFVDAPNRIIVRPAGVIVAKNIKRQRATTTIGLKCSSIPSTGLLFDRPTQLLNARWVLVRQDLVSFIH